ncbi:ABC transporter substrate-binding protein [Parafrankia discariae]|uniref:ABC transporter substrate-binding protein n=1 Tax=Parafrankia discariae TaxID=365528 RepID=UPI000381A5D0|nr:ABC transporter substrate-binding protein [Parafrankia discariae]
MPPIREIFGRGAGFNGGLGNGAGTSRRGFLIGGAAAASIVLVGCGDDDSGEAGAGGDGAWEYTDTSGTKITRPKRPERIVAYISSAAALWDFGVRPIAVFGPQETEDGKKEVQAGNIDLDAVDSVGVVWDDFNVEKFTSLNPDLVVTGMAGDDRASSLWAITPELLPTIEKIAPVAALDEFRITLPKVIESYQALAGALGADVTASAVTSAKSDFDAASAELRTAAAAKPGLKVMVVYADNDNLYVAKPDFFADLIYYTELGLDFVKGGGDEDYWEALSWEQASKYPADLILTDTRTFSLTREQMAAFPTWNQVPAVAAGQLGDWSAEPGFSYQLATPVIRKLTEAVKKARTNVVA